LNDRPTLQQLLEIQQHFGLPSPALVEKDWHVVRALAAIAAAETAPFKLVFGGGTALCRAHGLIRRMSEDIDLRVVAADKPSRRALRALRETVTNALQEAGFEFDPANESQRRTMYVVIYTIFRLPYAPATEGKGALRPEIQIETAVFPMRRPAVVCAVSSFVAQGYKRSPELAGIDCASIAETAAEKLVALTRRAGAELAGLRQKRDPTLVRHVYDLHVIRGHYDAADVAALAAEIMHADAELRGEKFPAYQKDPVSETVKAIEGIAADAEYAVNYTTFCRDMVYGDAPDFATAVVALKAIAAHLGHKSDVGA
jgi:predicted nucleotidyltransferase component of viral defense system